MSGWRAASRHRAANSFPRAMKSLSSSVSVRRLGQVAADACLVAAAYYLAYVLRFDTGIPHRYDLLLERTIVFVVVMKVALFALFGLYSKLWRFVDQKDFESILKAVVVATVLVIAALFLLFPSRTGPPRGVIALDFLITLALVGGSRFLVRAATERPHRPSRILERASREVLIVGAGNGGQQVAFELRRNPSSPRRRSASLTTTRASRACGSRASRCSAPPTSWPRSSTTSSRRR